MLAIDINNVSKKFRRRTERPLTTTLKSYFLQDFWKKKEQKRQFIWALKDINVKVKKGMTIGIIGQNGSGKSTLLKVINGIIKPKKF